MSQNIILLFGGDSDERLVSTASAQTMAQAIDCKKLWFWHKDGAIFEIDYEHLVNHQHPFTNELIPENTPIFNTIKDAICSDLSDNLVFLLAVHGGMGENGQLQKLLESKQRAFTGSNSQASQVAFNKVATKESLVRFSIKMAPHVVIETNSISSVNTSLNQFYELHGAIVLKPVCGGSSIGCSFIRTKEQIPAVSIEVMKYSPQPFLAEKIIHGREITVGVIENGGELLALPATEILLDQHHDFDYQGKYLGLGTKEITPADVADDQMQTAKRIALTAHKALSLNGYSRTDMIMGDDGFYFLEINTLPGLSKQSLVPQQLAQAGISMREFLLAQINNAIQKNCETKELSLQRALD